MNNFPATRPICVLALLTCSLVLLNCGTSSVSLQKITISPANPTIAKGATTQLGALGSYSDGSQQTLTDSVSWQTNKTTIATINDQGQVTAVGEGAAQVSASYQGVTGSTYITVGAPVLVSIAVSPSPSSVPVGESVQLTAIGNFSDGSIQNLTQSVTWSSSASNIATISSAGLASGLIAGSATITAASGDVHGAGLLTVGPAVLTSIAVMPGNSSIAAGNTLQFTATGTYSNGTTQNLTSTVTWSSPSPGVATITQAGMATAMAAGTASITATTGGITGSTTLTVLPPVLVAIAVTPGSPSIIAGTTQQFTATGTYSNGITQNLNGAVVWSSLVPGVATVTSAGTATGVAAGTAGITATTGGITGSTMLTVTAAVLTSIAVAPGNASISAGSTQQFTATGSYDNGTTQDLTSTVTWSSSVPGVAAIGNASGLATAAALGVTTITASSGSTTGSTTLTVTAGFVLTGSLNTAREYHTATLLNNGIVLVAGGFGANGALASAELYNPATGTFTPTGNLNTARGQHTATLLQNGTVLIAGGTGDSGNVASAEIYNPATGTFTPTGSLNTARTMHTATMLSNGAVLIAGGLDPNNLALASAELYSPASGTFTFTGSLNTARSLHTATLLDTGIVLIAGGNPPAAQASAELYNPTTATFTVTGNLTIGRYDHTATLLNGGLVLIAGGTGSSGTVATAELYSAGNGIFTPTGSLSTARFEHTASLLNNGTVLTAAGFATNGSLNSAELYDATSADFELTGNLNDARYSFTATLLNNGMTLVAGGYNGSYLASAELYEPGGLTPPNLVSISLAPTTPTVPLGAAQPMIATGTFSDNTTAQLASVTWNSSNTAAISITNDATDPGAAYAAASGSATVSACAGSVCGSTAVTVGPSALVTIAVTPANGTIASGLSLQFSATGTYTDGSTKSLTSASSLTWNSSNPNVATIAAGGLATAQEMGTSSITATIGSITGTANLTVTLPSVVSLSISPPTLFMSAGSTAQLQAIANLSDGSTQVMDGSNAQWSVNGPAIATVSNGGVVTAVQDGSTSIVAQSNGFTASASLTVASVATVNVVPATLSMAPNTTSQFHAIATLSDGKTQDVTASVSWSSMQPTIAGVSSGGLVTALLAGSATIVAQGNGFSGSANLTVLAPTALNIVPSSVSMVIGSSRQLRAIATLGDGTFEDVTAVTTWSSAQPAIANVSSNGIVTAMQVGSTTITAQADGQTGSASLTVVPLLLVNYFNLANALNSGIDGTVELTNPNTPGGNLCAMVYVFDQNQEMNECCGCSISDNGLLTMSLINDLTANPLTGSAPSVGVVMVVPSNIAPNPQCNPASLAPAGLLRGWETNDQPAPGGTFQITETPYAPAPLTGVEATSLATECSFIENEGSGQGICSCGTGDGESSQKSMRTRIKH